ncbi:beta-ketoacyl-ACP synthase [Halioxenophilus aromaticivorans]
MDIRLLDYQSTTAAWQNRDALRPAIDSQSSGLRRNDLPGSDVDTWIGRVAQVDGLDLGPWQCRNNALADYCLRQGQFLASVETLKQYFDAARIGIIVGSSTSAIDRTETAYQQLTDDGELAPEFQQPEVHNPHALGLYVAHTLGITGPSMTINTACSSSAKVFASAARWLAAGVVDAVVVGGTDALGLSVVHGFNALQLVSPAPCQPFDQNRTGINIGEAAGFALLANAEQLSAEFPLSRHRITLSGYGESSDAHHMSHPHPEGTGARLAMQQALSQAKLQPAQIDYVNLHGTASQANDAIEGDVISVLFGENTLCSSTKGWTGHTLGAAGITEALIAVDTLISGIVPANLNLQQQDPRLTLPLPRNNVTKLCQHVMSNSFGFGGNNCSLIFSATAS